MGHVAIAASSQLAADVGVSLAEAGGNAIDVAVGVCLASMCTDPGIVAPGAGGYISVLPAGQEPLVIDAYVEMPGRGRPAARFGRGGRRVAMDYGGGMETIVGYGSVATPGALAGLGSAHRRFGRLPWAEVLAPTIEAVAAGFPLSAVSAMYLTYSHEVIFGWDPESRRVLHRDDGTPKRAGDIVHMPDLAETLRHIAEEGPDHLYRGELGRRLVEACEAHGGLITGADLEEYRAIDRTPTSVQLDGWTVATNPPPAVGGAVLAAILLLMKHAGVCSTSPEDVAAIVEAQRAVLSYRTDVLDRADDRVAAAEALLGAARLGAVRSLLSSPSTSHTSAVDDDGNACAITVSAGYGSGAIIPGTGFFLNNCLGEIELLPQGFHALPPGTRMISNMAPTVARRQDGSVLAIGSPGADRITTALSQVIHWALACGLDLDEAVHRPRVHVEVFGGDPTAAVEPGLPDGPFPGLAVRRFPELSMYFGGVQAAAFDRVDGLVAVADSRRGGVAVVADA